MDDESRVEKISRLISLLITLYMLWTIIPKHRRKLMLMKIVHSAKNSTLRLANASGRFAMRAELAGEDEAADLGYSTAYSLMTGAYGRCVKWYDRLRDTIV